MLTPPQGIDFSGLFSPLDLAARGSVIFAISGGSDSTALLTLFKDYLDRFAPKTRPVAVTVDHALRPESASEAAGVARLCARLGIAHRVVSWSGDKPATGIAATAREARHDLLAAAACAEGSDLVLTGHTADDQAETVVMRQARGDAGDHTGRGLAGIAPATLFDGLVWFARPLLSVRREALRALLRKRGIGWIDDPTNADERHERPRLRKRLTGPGGEAAVVEALRVAAAAASHREEAGNRAATLIRANAVQPVPGLLRLRPDFFTQGDREGTLYALRILLAVAGGTPHLPDDGKAAKLLAHLAREGPVRAALSRALVDKRKSGVFLLREARDLPDRTDAREGAIWDGRYRVLRVAPEAGGSTAQPVRQCEQVDVPDSLLTLAAAAQPDLPPGLSAVPLLAPWARFLPSFDVVVARAAAELTGATEIPEPPLREHIESKA